MVLPLPLLLLRQRRRAARRRLPPLPLLSKKRKSKRKKSLGSSSTACWPCRRSLALARLPLDLEDLEAGDGVGELERRKSNRRKRGFCH